MSELESCAAGVGFWLSSHPTSMFQPLLLSSRCVKHYFTSLEKSRNIWPQGRWPVLTSAMHWLSALKPLSVRAMHYGNQGVSMVPWWGMARPWPAITAVLCYYRPVMPGKGRFAADIHGIAVLRSREAGRLKPGQVHAWL